MPKNVTCDWLNLEMGIKELLSDIEPTMERELEVEIPKAGRKVAKELRSEAGAKWGSGKTGSTYSHGFSSRSKRAGKETSSEIGNKAMPGLVHLLEKGHATLTGRRTAAYPHLEPVYERVAVPELEKAVNKAVDKALEG